MQDIDGILVQLPLPKQVDTERIIAAVHPKKDVDGFHPFNLGLLFSARPRFVPCTPQGIMTLLAEYRIERSGYPCSRGRAQYRCGSPDVSTLYQCRCNGHPLP